MNKRKAIAILLFAAGIGLLVKGLLVMTAGVPGGGPVETLVLVPSAEEKFVSALKWLVPGLAALAVAWLARPRPGTTSPHPH